MGDKQFKRLRKMLRQQANSVEAQAPQGETVEIQGVTYEVKRKSKLLGYDKAGRPVRATMKSLENTGFKKLYNDAKKQMR